MNQPSGFCLLVGFLDLCSMGRQAIAAPFFCLQFTLTIYLTHDSFIDTLVLERKTYEYRRHTENPYAIGRAFESIKASIFRKKIETLE